MATTSARYQKAREFFVQLIKDNALPKKEATVLLIGSTGMGKSTLGNYLLDPERKDKSFATARHNRPETQSTQSDKSMFCGTAVEALGYSSVQLTVIDTPGLNESDAADLKHMIGIVEELEKLSEIAACIFVVKFTAKIDAQYIKTIEYYSRLLPSLFEKNVFVVMTDYAMDPRSVAIREQEGIDEKQVVENATKEIVCSANLSYDNLVVFKLDCLPFSPDEIAYSEGVHDSIIEYIVQLKVIKLDNLKVAKTEKLLKMDSEQIQKYNGEIDTYKKTLIELNEQSREVLNTIQEKESKVAQSSARIDAIRRELDEKDTAELVTAATWSVDTEWKFCTTLRNGCELKSRWKIVEVVPWTNGKCKWSDMERSDYVFKGKVTGRFMHGLYANVTLETEKRIKYATEIKELQKNLEAAMTKHELEKKDLDEYREKEYRHEAAIAAFKKFIEEKREKIQLLEATRLTIPEARRRLHSISQQHSLV